MSELNNTLDISVPPLTLPDFTLSDAVLTDTAVDFTIHNLGPGDFSGSLVYRLEWLNADNGSVASFFGAMTIASLEAGGAVDHSHGGDAFILGRPVAATRLRITVNPAGALHREEGQGVSNVIEVAAPETPPAAPPAATLSPDFVPVIDALTSSRVELTFRNSGAGPFTGILSWQLAWVNGAGTVLSSFLDGDYRLWGAGESVSFVRENIPFLLGRPAAAAALRVTVNPAGDFFTAVETNTTNNIASRTVSMSGSVDLIVDSPVLTASALEFTVRNVGDADAGAGVPYRLEWLGGDRGVLSTVVGAMIASIFAGDSASGVHGGSFIYARPGDAAYIRFTVNPAGASGAIAELDTSNNSMELRLVTDDTTGATLVEEEEDAAAEESADEAGGYEPSGDRGGFAGFFRQLGQGIKILTTIDPAAKTELRLRFANEKILDAQVLNKAGKIEEAEKQLGRYVHDMSKVMDALERLDKTDADAGKHLATRVLGNQLNHQILLGAIERRPSSTLALNVREIRDRSIEDISRTVHIFDHADEVTALFTHELSKRGNPINSIRSLAILSQVADRVPAQAQRGIETAEAHIAERFARQYQTMPTQQQHVVAEYAVRANGDDGALAKAIDLIEEVGSPSGTENVKHLERAKINILNRLDERLQSNPGAERVLLRSLERGTAENIRVLQSLEGQASLGAQKIIAPVKERATKNFVNNPEALKKLPKPGETASVKIGEIVHTVEQFIQSESKEPGKVQPTSPRATAKEMPDKDRLMEELPKEVKPTLPEVEKSNVPPAPDMTKELPAEKLRGESSEQNQVEKLLPMKMEKIAPTEKSTVQQAAPETVPMKANNNRVEVAPDVKDTIKPLSDTTLPAEKTMVKKELPVAVPIMIVPDAAIKTATTTPVKNIKTTTTTTTITPKIIVPKTTSQKITVPQTTSKR